MTGLTSLEDIEQLYAARGGLHYGEGVTQLEHALQCAVLAQAEGAPPSVIVAALLHDIGHLVEKEEDVTGGRFDDRHETVGARMLEGFFPESVYRPVALHVAAKRYLCATDASYYDRLSAASKHSLALQGGPFDGTGIAEFEARPFHREAVRVRLWDDGGKVAGLSVPTFAELRPLLERVSLAAS